MELRAVHCVHKGKAGRGERIRTFDLLNPILGQARSENHSERALRPDGSTVTLNIQPVEGTGVACPVGLGVAATEA